MRIKQRAGILAVAVIAAVTVTALAAAPPDSGQIGGESVSDPSEMVTTAPDPIDIQSTAATEKCYWVHQQDGMVAVFDADNRIEPINITEIALHTLREGDQAMILGGVLIEGETNLYHFLEGFGP